MFTGGFGDESRILSLAAKLEQAQSWLDRRHAEWDAVR